MPCTVRVLYLIMTSSFLNVHITLDKTVTRYLPFRAFKHLSEQLFYDTFHFVRSYHYSEYWFFFTISFLFSMLAPLFLSILVPNMGEGRGRGGWGEMAGVDMKQARTMMIDIQFSSQRGPCLQPCAMNISGALI